MRGLPLDAANPGSHTVNLGSVGDNPARPFYFCLAVALGPSIGDSSTRPVSRAADGCLELRPWSYVDTEYLGALRLLTP